MKLKDIIIIGLIVALGFFYFIDRKNQRAETVRIIDSTYRAQQDLIRYDSIQSAITERVLDTVLTRVEVTEKGLRRVQRVTDNTAKENEKLKNKFDSLVVDRPDF